MGKVELKLEIDADLLARAKAQGVEPEAVLDAGLRSALKDPPRPLGLVESAREKARDPGGAAQRAQAWAEENREAIEDHNARMAERGLVADRFRRFLR